MGTLHVGALVENHTDRRKSFRIAKLLVDTGSEHTWLPESFLDKIGVKREKKDVSFMMANGTIVTRSIGFAIMHVDKYFTIRDQMVMNARGKVNAATISYIARMVVANSKKWECRVTLKCRFLVGPAGGNQSCCPERISKVIDSPSKRHGALVHVWRRRPWRWQRGTQGARRLF